MKLMKAVLTATLLTVIAPIASAQNETADKKTIYVINGKRAEPFDPTVADMSAFKEIVKESQTAKLAAEAGITDQESAERKVVFLKSKKPMYIAAAGQSVDYSGTVSCEGDTQANVCILTQCGETDADGQFACRAKYYTKGYVYAKGYRGRRITFASDLRKKITLNPTDIKPEKSDTKKPKYSIVNGEYVRIFDIGNYEPDDIVSVKYVWEQTDEVCAALMNAHIKPKFVEQYGAEVVTLRSGIKLAKPKNTSNYSLDVRDREGNPISGARIFMEQAYTKPDGYFALTADCGTRAIAMYKNNAVKNKRFKLGATPLLHLTLERNPKYEEMNNEPVIMADVMPKYMGGDLITFRNWVMNYITYPKTMHDLRIGGRVLVGFTVNKEGDIEDIKIIESPNDDFSNEVIKVLKRSKRWTPARDAGNPVSVRYVLPIDFKIN